MSDNTKTPHGNSLNDKEPQHKHSLERETEIANEIKEALANGTFVRPSLIVPAALSGRNFSQWIDNAFREAQEDKERQLGRRPQKPEKQPSVAISNFNRDWATSHMNNKRELGSKK